MVCMDTNKQQLVKNPNTTELQQFNNDLNKSALFS